MEKPQGAAHGAADGNGAVLSEKTLAMMNEGVGDCMAYRRRKGRFTVVEWLFSIILPILVILLGKALTPALAGLHTAGSQPATISSLGARNTWQSWLSLCCARP